jgi:trehalose synthase
MVIEADVPALDPSRFESILDASSATRFGDALTRGAALMEGRTIVHVNSTMTGGGVAELLASVLGYLLGAGISSRWLALEGSEEFFVVTKRIHHLLHGKDGDGGGLGTAETDIYQSVLAAELDSLAAHIQPGDVVVLHDPQVVGLAPALRDLGAHVIWNCHVGADVANAQSRQAWEFLLPSATAAQAQVFSRAQYEWEGLETSRVAVIPPCIDAFSPKNQGLEPRQVAGILAATGIAKQHGPGVPTFERADGSRGSVSRTTVLIEEGPVPIDAPVVTQVSRWDPLKDHEGLAQSFAHGVPLELGAHLVLAGPSPEAVADDPEGSSSFRELCECTASLPEAARSRVHVACLPMDDVEENAAVVNALQRRSDVVVQKSLAEGFGLTVAEAMWKGRPTVASAVGGIKDQICDGVSGLLVDDPQDIDAFGQAITSLLRNRRAADALGQSGRASVLERFLAPTYLGRYLALIEQITTA